MRRTNQRIASRSAVIAVLQMPAPVNGLSTVNEAMVKELNRVGICPTVVDIAPPVDASRARLIVVRAARVLRAVFAMRSAAYAGAKTLYFSPDSGGGLLFNLVMLIAARVLKLRVVYHHHNSSYVDRQSLLMKWAIRIGPIGSTHIVLCDAIGGLMVSRYKAVWENRQHSFIVLSNAFILSSLNAADQLERQLSQKLIIGHLANLSVAKGALRFLAVFGAIADVDPDVCAVIAGPIGDPEVRASIRDFEARYPDRFQWLGPIYGREKIDFYESLDVFLFPTDYVNEVQPLVLFEALSHGVAVLATDRGCIACDISVDAGAIFPLHDFHQRSIDWLRDLKDSPEKRLEIRERAVRAFERIRSISLQCLPSAISAIAGD